MKAWTLALLHCAVLAGCAYHPTSPSSAPTRLVVDAMPCAGEVHLALADLALPDGRHLNAEDFAELPVVLLYDGQNEVEIGKFCEGCSGGLRVHAPLPETRNPRPRIIIRGRLKDGTSVAGMQIIDADHYR